MLPEPIPDDRPARPAVRWLGGKTRLLPSVLPLLAPPSGRYFEPFCGGAAAYLALAPRLSRPALVSDANAALVSCYRALAEDPEGVADLAAHMVSRHTRDRFLRARELLNRRRGAADAGHWPHRVTLAATVLYLSRASYGGVWRENMRGEYNVPPRADRPPPLDRENLLRVAALLARAEVRASDFRCALALAGEGDLAYLDPPYPPGRPGGFSSYLAGGFGARDHEDLRDAALAAARRGCRVVVSIADCAVSRSLWGPAAEAAGGEVRELEAPRAVGARHRAARTARELVIVLPGAAP
jgi:DNA adenine methylase